MPSLCIYYDRYEVQAHHEERDRRLDELLVLCGQELTML